MQKDNKRELRETKRIMKQLGNQQVRKRTKNALKRITNGEADDMPDVDMDEGVRSKYLNGFDEKARS